MWEFEVNPIYILSKSVILLSIFKFATISGITYLILKYKRKPKKSHFWSYMLIFMAIWAILGQFLGAYTNFDTKIAYEQDPISTKPLNEEVAMDYHVYLHSLFLYFPMFLAGLTFLIWEKIYLKPFKS